MRYGFRVAQSAILLVSLLLINAFAPSIVFANDKVIATATLVEGEVNYYPSNNAPSRFVELNTTFVEGDRIMTGDDSKIEIVFNTGGMILLDSNSDMTIQSLQRDNQGVFSIILYLGIGILKSSLSKIVDQDLVEYHTKTVVIGIAGTPDHIIRADMTAENVYRTRVYLFGKAGDKGSLYIRSRDPDKTQITLFPGQVTTILAGLAPTAPLILTPELMKSIGHLIFSVGPQAVGGGAITSASVAGASAGTAAAGAGASASVAGVSAGTAAAVGGGAAVAGVAVANDRGNNDGKQTTYTVSINLPDNGASTQGRGYGSDKNSATSKQSLRDYCRMRGWLSCYHDLADNAQDTVRREGACCKEYQPCTMLVDPTGHPVFENSQRSDCPGYTADNGWSCVVCEW